MGRPPKNATVDVIDFSQEPYEPNDTKERILAKYGADSELQHIYLKRYDKSGILKGLRKYPELPDEDSIKNEFGGGNYELWVTFRDPNTSSGRNMAKIPIMIEGTSITPDYAGTETKTTGAPVISEEEQENKMLDKMTKWKAIFGGGNNDNSRIELIIKQMEMQQAQILALINKKDDSSSSKLQELILTKAFDNSRSDLDVALKFKKLFDQGGPQTADEWGWLKAMAPALLPLLAKAVAGNKTPAYPLNGAMLPAGPQAAGNDITAAINSIAQAVNQIGARVDAIQNEIREIKEGIEIIPDDENPGAENPAAGDNNISLIQNNQGEGMNEEDPLIQIAEQIKNASGAEQNALLKQLVDSTGAAATFDFCLKYELVKDAAEFNKRLADIGSQERV